MARWLAFCETELAGDGLTDQRRAVLEEKADVYRRALKGHCRRCGRTLSDPESIARGLGSECVKSAVSA